MLDIEHYLNIYKFRKKIFEEGITNPVPEIQLFISEIIEKLSSRPLDEKVNLIRNDKGILELKNEKNEIIVTFPDLESLAKKI